MISDSEDESSEDDAADIDEDANLSPDALRKRYANLPDLVQDLDEAIEDAGQASSPSPNGIEDEDDSDHSTEMDSEMDSESEDETPTKKKKPVTMMPLGPVCLDYSRREKSKP